MEKGVETIFRLQTFRPAYAISTAAGVLCLLSACSSGPVTTVHLSLVGAPKLNPDETGAPNPVQVRVFMLKTSEAFTNTDYFQFTDKERAVLGADLVSQTNEVLRPGQTKAVDLLVQPGTKFVGVSAAYRNIDQATWRVVGPIADRVTVNAGPDALTIVAQPK